MHPKFAPLVMCSLAAALAACGGGDTAPAASSPVASAPPADDKPYYQTKTPYAPQQAAATYEAPPSGYAAVFTELVARHGSRGLSGVKYDAALYNIWQKAAADGALTPLGAQLGPDILKIMKANALLGYGVDGIGTPGYGNLSQLGINEHRQLAVRMRTRMAALFDDVAAHAASAPRRIVVVSSGVDRARDSAANFTKSLVTTVPDLAPLVTQPAGTDRFTLYFHALKEATDKVVDPADPHYRTYQDSQAYQAYLKSPDYLAKIGAIATDANAKVVARALLERLFSKAFVDKIDNGTYTFANTGSYSFVSDDGKFAPTVTGDGKTTVTGVVDAASMLYNLYVITPGMKNELDLDFTRYVPSAQARYMAYLQDWEDFYKQGPGFTESDGVTYRMAQALEDDFFDEVDAIEAGRLANAAKLRFTHAEIIVPFASRMGLKNVLVPLPKAQTYTYENNPWRGEYVAPLAANMQWDVFRNDTGKVVVRMLYNEKETDFKAECDGAKIAPASHYYDYTRLKACYGHVPAA